MPPTTEETAGAQVRRDAGDRSPGTLGTGTGGLDSGAPAWTGWQAPLGCFLIVGAVMLIAQWVSFRYWGVKISPNMAFPGRGLLDGLVRYDAGWYVSISRDGYSLRPGAQSNVAFFPSYPVAMRGVASVVGDHVLAGIVLTSLSGAALSVALWTWLGRVGLDQRERWTAFGAQMLYPYGFFLYGVIYSDTFVLLAAVGVFLLAEYRHWWLAGLLGIVVTAGRPSGLAIAAGLLVFCLERSGTLRPPDGDGLLARWRVPVRFDRRRLRADQVLPAVISASGLVAFSSYLWVRWGDPKLFSTVQEFWGQQSGLATTTKEYYRSLLANTKWSELLTRPQSGLEVGTRSVQAAILLTVLASVPFIGRRFGWGYATFVAVGGVVPLLFSADFQGSGRYMMAAFPAFALLGAWLARRPALARSWIVLSGLAAVAMMTFFSHGVYLT
ncbi:MAG: hypothetical protein FJW94_13595 [Actinobacteria bacterium]|nr:hypothetical protein [Actinomycetota bacterium]